MEIGIASATFGLILASIMGGPIAKVLIRRDRLTPSPEALQECQDVGLTDAQKREGIGHLDFLDAVLAIHICIVVGFLLNGLIADLGLRLPLFVTCLFAGILITNLVPKGLPSLTGTHWPSRTPAMALIADIALGHLPRHVPDEHAALDPDRSGRPHPGHPGGPVRPGGDRDRLGPVPAHGPRL